MGSGILEDERGIVIASVPLEATEFVTAGGRSRELASRFEFAKQKSKLDGIIRGSYFVIKDEH